MATHCGAGAVFVSPSVSLCIACLPHALRHARRYVIANVNSFRTNTFLPTSLVRRQLDRVLRRLFPTRRSLGCAEAPQRAAAARHGVGRVDASRWMAKACSRQRRLRKSVIDAPFCGVVVVVAGTIGIGGIISGSSGDSAHIFAVLLRPCAHTNATAHACHKRARRDCQVAGTVATRVSRGKAERRWK